MATNRELKVEIETLSEQLGVSIETDRLNNSSLAELVKSLREQLEAREAGAEHGDVMLEETEYSFSSPGLGDMTVKEVARLSPGPNPSDLLEALKADEQFFGGSGLVGATKRGLDATVEVEPTPDPPPAESAPAPPVAPATTHVLTRRHPPPPEPEPVLSNRYFVAQGCVVYGARGKLGAFKPVQASDVGGPEALAALVEGGQVTRGRPGKKT